VSNLALNGAGRVTFRGVSGAPMSEASEFFDASFLEELRDLAHAAEEQHLATAGVDLHERLGAVLAPLPGSSTPLDAAAFLELPDTLFRARGDVLLEICRESPRRGALEDVENFIVFIQALVPTLSPEGAHEIKRAFFRLIPTLLHIAHHDFSGREEDRTEGHAALDSLQNVLLEISSVRLAPSEGDLVFRSVDQLAALIDAGQYAMADELVSSRLLALIRKNKVARALYRIMEVEVSVQRYLKDKLGHPTPQIRVPEDLVALQEYGAVRVLHEQAPGGSVTTYLQIQLPELPMLRDVVLRLVRDDGTQSLDKRLDNLGCTPLEVDPGTYRIGLVYQPEGA